VAKDYQGMGAIVNRKRIHSEVNEKPWNAKKMGGRVGEYTNLEPFSGTTALVI
jgi:hypothetical protein